MVNKKLLLIGGGGHCKSIISSIDINEYSEIGIVDPHLKVNTKVRGISVMGNDDDLPKLKKEGFTFAFISMGSIGSTNLRKKLYTLAVNLGFHMVNIIDKTAVLDSTVLLGDGIFIGKNVIINAESKLGDCCIVNSGAIIEHECFIGEFSHIAPGAVICGDCYIDEDIHIGANACIKQGIRINKEVLVGMGSVVTKNLIDSGTYVGIPVKKIN